jgi:large subunit ribosomal protein L21
MYAVVSTGGKQYRVEAGTTLTVERLAVQPGETVTFDRVLLVGDGDELTVGTPTVAGASVSGTVLATERGPKLIIFKFKNKSRYRRRNGHRQDLTRVRIDAIEAAGTRRKTSAKAVAADEAEKPEAKPRRSRPTRTKAASDAKAASARKPASAKAESKAEAKAPGAKRKTTTPKRTAPKKAESEE